MVICMFKAIFVIIGTIIGAGFASGKEIFTFFNLYGMWGFLGLVLTELIIGFVLYKVFCIILGYDVTSYNELIENLFGKTNFATNVLCNIINIFLLVSFIVMVAGFAAYFSQEYALPYFFGAFIMAMLSFITFLKNIEGIVKVNSFFIPCLIIVIVILGLKNVNCFVEGTNMPIDFNYKFIISSVLYASYNLIIALPILITLKKYVVNYKQAKFVSFVTMLLLLFMSIIIFLLLNYYFTEIINLELPTVYIATKSGLIYKYICGILILGAIFTTAISNGYSFLNNLNFTSRKNYIITVVLICFSSIVFSHIGFATLLNLLYPILGLLRIIANNFYTVFFKNTLKILCFIDISI